MNDQGDLFEYAAALAHTRTSDPLTSHAAAASVKVRESQQKVLALLAEGPATHEELVARAQVRGVLMSQSGIRSRCRELVDAGMVEDTGQRVKLTSGRHAIVWQVAS